MCVTRTKRITRETKNTVERLALEWYLGYVEKERKRHLIIKKQIDADIIPLLGRVELEKLKTVDISEALDLIVARGAPIHANQPCSELYQTKSFLYEVKSSLPMNYDYKGVPNTLTTKVIGYAPESTFVHNGWSGAVEFFIPSFGGVCAFREVNIEITKSAAYLSKEVVTYKVNKKLTTMNVVGNKESGFVYEIEWWDKKFKRTLECASKEYSGAISKATIELAKNIDKA